MTDHWTGYWQQGHLTSLPHGFSANYDGEFLGFWNEQFATLGKGASVLDVCSGNGSIALLAQDYSASNKLDLNVMALDAADIDVAIVTRKSPRLAQHLKSIEFFPNTPLENMPQATESLDLVTSQYGIEYSDWSVSAKNIVRALKVGGHFSLVCHSVESTVMKEMERQQADYVLLRKVELFANEVQLERNTDFPKKFVQQLDQTLDAIYTLFEDNRSSAVFSGIGSNLDEIRKLTLKQFDAGLNSFIQLREAVIVGHAISDDLLSVNYALQKSPRWYEVFIDEGLELIASGDIRYHTGQIAGKFYRFSRPT